MQRNKRPPSSGRASCARCRAGRPKRRECGWAGQKMFRTYSSIEQGTPSGYWKLYFRRPRRRGSWVGTHRRHQSLAFQHPRLHPLPLLPMGWRRYLYVRQQPSITQFLRLPNSKGGGGGGKGGRKLTNVLDSPGNSLAIDLIDCIVDFLEFVSVRYDLVAGNDVLWANVILVRSRLEGNLKRTIWRKKATQGSECAGVSGAVLLTL